MDLFLEVARHRRGAYLLRRRSPRLAWPAVALVLATVAAACGGTPAAVPKPHGSPPPSVKPRAVNTPATFTCKVPVASQQKPMVSGDPDLASVPAIETIGLTPSGGGLILDFKFRTPFELAPPGVYISWTVYLYRNRGDAANSNAPLELQIEDRGAGWEPTGWTILASINTNATPVDGSIHTDAARDELSTFFPAGFANMQPPFYWYASQEEYRAYLPEKTDSQDWSINGSVITDCPPGIRPNPFSDQLPDGSRLLVAL